MSDSDIIYQVKGAFGFWHSVPAGQLEEFSKRQKEVENNGELLRFLQEWGKYAEEHPLKPRESVTENTSSRKMDDEEISTGKEEVRSNVK